MASLTASAEADAKAKIREYLGSVLPECFIPELGEQKQGKVRSIYFSGENVVMVTNDRVSAFDFILPNLIPFKGQVLNMISEWCFSKTADIVPNALVANVDPSVVVQQKMKNLNIELIVRGYLWGSMAAAYEKGDRTFCGLSVPDGLNRFQKFDVPVFTPTTKAEVGHDENMTLEDMEKLVGKELAQQAKDVALKLYQRGSELMRARGLILIDTKYEFGVDEKGTLHVIDEVNTPDSSRLCDVEEWETKYPKIAAEMATGSYKTVTDVLKAKPELKMKEFSKQYIRDALLDMGFDPHKDKAAPKLSEDQVVECAYRYISIYERITGERFAFPDSRAEPSSRILRNLQRASLATGAFVVLLVDSELNLAHAQSIQQELAQLEIPSRVRVCSAQQQPSRLQALIAQYNKSIEPLLIVCAAGNTVLASVASSLSRFPVVSCSPEGPHQTADGAVASIAKPAHLARFAAQLFSHGSPRVAAALEASTRDDIAKLEAADAALLK